MKVYPKKCTACNDGALLVEGEAEHLVCTNCHRAFTKAEVDEKISVLKDDPELLQAARQLHHWQYRQGTNFSSMLYELIAKADASNKAKIAKGFYNEVAVFMMWQSCARPEEFFKLFGIEVIN